LKMDPNRRELYVEGSTDVAFVRFVAADARDPNALIHAIADVDISATEDGEKGRLIAFATAVEPETRVLCFADADHDRLHGVTHTANVVLTDMTDMEAYVLNEACLSKALLLGVQTTRHDAKAILDQVIAAARQIGILRYVQRRHWRSLPVNGVTPASAVVVRDGQLLFDFPRFVSSVVARHGKDPSLGQVIERIAEATEELSGVADADIVRGKDAMALLAEYLKDLGVCRNDSPKLVRMGFDVTWVTLHSNLARVVDFVSVA